MDSDRASVDSIAPATFPRRPSQHLLVTALVLLVVAVIGAIDMPAFTLPADPYYWRQEAYSILNNHSLAVDPAARQGDQPYVLNPLNGQWYSKYGLMNAVMFLPPVFSELWIAPRATPLGDTDVRILNAWNIILSVALAWVLLTISRRYTHRTSTQLLFVFTCLYGTMVWYYLRAQGGELYQLLFYGLLFLCLTKFLNRLPTQSKPPVGVLSGVWFFVACLVFTRIVYLLLIPLVIGFTIRSFVKLQPTQRRALLPGLIIPPCVILLLLGWLNDVKFGSPFLSGYHQAQPELHHPTGPLFDGVWGFLFMPRFSVFLYFPPAALGLVAIRKCYQKFPIDTLVATITFAAFVLALGKVPTWAGEWTYGPRYMLFALPALSIPFIVLLDQIQDNPRAWRNVAMSVIVAWVILYSAWLQFRVNSIHFYAYYYIRTPIEQYWTDSMAGYFRDHHVGTITDDLLRNADDLDSMPWFAELKLRAPEPFVQAYRARVSSILHAGNRYWFKD